MILVVIMDITPRIRATIRRNFRNCIEDVEFVNWNANVVETILYLQPSGIILTGSTARILDTGVPKIDSKVFEIGIPILGICYGYQTLIKHYVGRRGLRSYADIMECPVDLVLHKPFNVPHSFYRLSHYDDIVKIPDDWQPVHQTGFSPSKLHHANEKIGCYHPTKKHMGIIFHPEKRVKTGRTFFAAWKEWIH